MSTRSGLALSQSVNRAPSRRGGPSGPPELLGPPPYRRKLAPRLATFDYTGPYAYHLVLSTYKELPLLATADVVETCLRRLREASERRGFQVLAYCFMPTHLHLLIVGSEDSRLLPFVKHFKQTTSFDCSGEAPQLWQPSFYDRVLRVEEDLEDIARYIWGNPVRAGMVDDWEKFPFSGPFGADLKVRPYEEGHQTEVRAVGAKL